MKIKFLTFFFLFFVAGQVFAQSTVQDYPTLVSSNEIIGKIKARDIGDSRQTTYFYTFNGNQGDLFVNVETNNLNADIDIFTIADLRPLTKIVVYAGNELTETGRVVFLRKTEKILLRIKGRTPNDDDGTFKIKFAGSFEAIADTNNKEIDLPTVKKQEETDVKVNSVGTIIEVKPKPTPAQAESVAEKEETKVTKDVKKSKSEQKETTQVPQSVSTTGKKVSTPKKPKPTPTPKETNTETEEIKAEKTEVAEKPKQEKATKPKKVEDKPETDQDSSKENSEAKEINEAKSESKTVAKVKPTKSAKPKTEKTPKPKSEKEASPTKSLENIKLIVLFKDGTKFERKMDEVNHVGVDKGILTIITNKGEVLRYSILDVEKMTIE